MVHSVGGAMLGTVIILYITQEYGHIMAKINKSTIKHKSTTHLIGPLMIFLQRKNNFQ